MEEAIDEKCLKVVTAAVIRDASGRVLIAQRKHDQALGSKWEFLGGKVEAGETLEEMGIKIMITGRAVMVDNKYPDFDIRLCAMKAEITSGELNLNDHESVIWVRPEEFLGVDLTPADQLVAEAFV